MHYIEIKQNKDSIFEFHVRVYCNLVESYDNIAFFRKREYAEMFAKLIASQTGLEIKPTFIEVSKETKKKKRK